MIHSGRFGFALLTILILSLLTLSTSSAGTIYVRWDSPNDGPGNDWDHACHTIQAGLNAAVSSDGVWVAAGTYVEKITLKDGVELYGGFAGTETLREQRSWTANVTILNGAQEGSVVTAPLGATATTVIDGFTVWNGSESEGGGIYCVGSSPTITNNTIMGNSASYGGGIYCLSSSPTITNNTIMANSGFQYGGGIYCSDSAPAITNNTIMANIGYHGGGIHCSSSSPTIANNTIIGNSGVYGGGIDCGCSSPTITNNTITGNTAWKLGGGICCDGSSSATVVNNIVAFNFSGICIGGTPTLRNNCVYGNTQYDYSGLPDPTGTDGNISVDPKLAGVEYGNVHIQPDSPCIDAGDDSVIEPGWLDMDGQPRIQGARVDIGADESDGTLHPPGPYAVVRVRPDGNDANDGSSWALAKRTVQAGTDAAAAAGGEVWVKAGTYNERITLRAYAYAYGGFAGTETTREQRNWESNATILDGQQGGSVVTMWTGHICSAVDGFIIRNGHFPSGGGICCSYSSPTITNNTITGNSADTDGGGVYCLDSSPAITNNTISGNSASRGGGIHCLSSSPAVMGNLIVGNSASSNGGGIYCSSSSPTIVDNAIMGNSASRDGGGIYCYSSSPAIAGNRITGNNAVTGGGGGIDCVRSSSTTITNNTIAGNTAYAWAGGGGIRCQRSWATIANNIIAFNSSGIYNSAGAPTLRNNDVYNPDWYNYAGLSPGTGDISEDPLFVDRPGGDYHLTSGSPCINAGWNDAPGLPLFDMDGQQRVLGIAVDIGADEYPWTAAAIHDARLSTDNTSVDLAGDTVSAAFADFFYIEADDRSGGIRVEKAGHGLSEGMRADVVGSVGTNSDGERYIAATTATPAGTGSVAPLGLNNKSLGGSDWFYNESIGAGQKEIAGAIGLNNIGLLVRTWGAVTSRASSHFSIDDGSGVGVKVVIPAGVKIKPPWKYVEVTGISSCEKVGDDLYRLIRVRDQADILPQRS